MSVDFQSATPVLRSSDYLASRAFMTEVLGFDCIEEAGDPVLGFGIFRRGRASIFVEAWSGAEAPYDRWRAYIHVGDAGAAAQDILSRGGALTRPLSTTEYGMREFEVTDPNGNVICFGSDA